MNEASWIVSLFFIGNIFGCLAGGYLNQKLGTKTLFLISAPISAVTWVMIAISHEFWLILVARVISGIFFGVFQANGKAYNTEIAHPHLRGSLATILGIMFNLGCMYTFVLGYFVQSWRTIALCQLVPCCILGISVNFVPDSPYWLVGKGRFEDAKKSLIILRGPDYDVNDELTEMLNKKQRKEERGWTVSQTLRSKIFLVPFLRIGTLTILTQWVGMNVINLFMVNIFIQSGSSVDPNLAPILVLILEQILNFCSALVLRVSPRKPLFLVLASGIAVSLAGLGTYNYFTKDSGDWGWLPLLCVMGVKAFRNLGFKVLIQLSLAESFPTEIR